MVMPIILLFEILILLDYGRTAFMKKKYGSEIENFEACQENEQTINQIRNLKFFSYNRTHKLINYDITYNRALDEKVGVGVTVERWGDGGWIGIPFIGFQPNVCKYMLKNFRKTWVDFYEQIGLAHPDQCPIPKGNYSVRNYRMDVSDVNIPFFSGRFRFTTKYIDANTKETIFCCAQIIKLSEIY